MSPLYLPYISPMSPLYLPYVSPISPLYLPYVSPISPLYLPYTFWLLAELQVPPTVAACTTYGCSPHHLRLQPAPPTVAARTTYGCSLHHLWLQVPLQQLTAAGYELVLTGHSLGAIVSIAIVSIVIVSTIQP